jgi:hypothetical protein
MVLEYYFAIECQNKNNFYFNHFKIYYWSAVYLQINQEVKNLKGECFICRMTEMILYYYPGAHT